MDYSDKTNIMAGLLYLINIKTVFIPYMKFIIVMKVMKVMKDTSERGSDSRCTIQYCY